MDIDSRFGTASLRQLADVLATTEDAVAEASTKLVGPDSVSRGWVARNAVTALLADAAPRRSLTEARPLIIAAFARARDTGKSDWETMTVPVFKNRLLNEDSGFDEREYGSPNIWHFATLFPDLIEPGGVRPREIVSILQPELVQSESTESSPGLDMAARGRVRADLWRAVFDYSARSRFVWDEQLGRARVMRDNEESLPVVPTMSPEGLRDLRARFVEDQTPDSDEEATRLNTWVSGPGSTAALPGRYRVLWNAFLKDHAASVVRTFFVSNGLSVPEDLIESAAGSRVSEVDVEEMRRIAHRYVDAMTGEELARLAFELAVIRRVSGA